MYNVSDRYMSAIESNTRKSTVTGYIYLIGNSEPIRLDDSNIIKDTLYVTNRCVNNSKLEFGSVYAGECGFTLIADISRYKLVTAKNHACINLDYNIIYDDGTTETIPLGVFYVDSATRTGKLVKITAIDAMSNLDEEVTDDITGDFKTLVKYITDMCDLFLAQTDAELDALHVNALETYSIRPAQVDTYRDAISYLSSVVCCFATIDRNGDLRFTPFSSDLVDVNTEKTRLLGCSFEDYSVKYNGVKARFFANENYYPYKSKQSNDKDALILDLGDIPIVGGDEKRKQTILDNICDTVTGIAYTPTQLYIPSNPAYDLGDFISCDNANGSGDCVYTYIMEYKFEYRKKETLKCFGENPRLQSITDKNSKATSSAESQIESKSIVVVTGRNADEKTVKDESVVLCDIKYSATADCKPIIFATVQFTLDLDGIVEFELYDLMTPIEDAVFRGYYTAGVHTQTITYVQTAKQDDRFTIRLLAKCEADAESKTRKQDAKIATLENAFKSLSNGETEYATVSADATAPKASVKVGGAMLCAFTQGIGGGKAWDGTLEFSENIESVGVSSVSVSSFTDAVATKLQEPTKEGFTEIMDAIEIDSVTISGINDYINDEFVVKNAYIDTTCNDLMYNSKYVSSNSKFVLNTTYKFYSEQGTIDSGQLAVVSMDLTQFSEVESVVIE